MSNAPEPIQSPDEIDALRSIVEATASTRGDDFFHSLVRHLAQTINVAYAFVAEFAGPMRARTLAYWKQDHIVENIEWDLIGSPCEDVVRGSLCHYPADVANKFPDDVALVDMGIESYLGVPLKSNDGTTLGHLAVFDNHPMPPEPRRLFIFRIFAARAAAELQRLRYDTMLAESERRYRDLYDKAPIAYIYEDLESNFISANAAAMRLLGLKPEDIPGTKGITLVAPDSIPRVQEAIRLMADGKEHAGIELELRRKDDGRPVWVQWWSTPEPDGRHTRTMIVDITDRVLMERQQNYLREEIKSVHNFEEIIGQSPALVTVLDDVRRVAPTDTSVLITGETGTGKELFARAIHSSSSRKNKPLVKVNCAALPTGLVESELFGHERGAFSGAINRRIGRFELADGGTIFLDEIGEIPLEVQVKLLRVIQEREFERVGGSASIRCDVRIIAATNRDLLKCVREGTFRADLYYRLNVFPIHLPPLRARTNDIPLLVQFLVSKFSGRMGKRISSIASESMQRLESYPWPGNIRELENVLERAVVLCNGSTLEIGRLLETKPSSPALAQEPIQTDMPGNIPATGLQDLERNHILSVLKQTRWIIDGDRGAAKILQIHPNTLRSRLKKMGISRDNHHENS